TPHDGGDDTWPRSGPAAPVFPLAHTATIRLALPLVPARRAPAVDLAALPDAERVARGWAAHAQPPGSMRLVIPDDPTPPARAQLLITHDDVDAPLAGVG